MRNLKGKLSEKSLELSKTSLHWLGIRERKSYIFIHVTTPEN